MTDTPSTGLTKLLRKAQMTDDVDFLREGVRVFSEAVMEREVTQHVGAERHERAETRTGQRNGYRERRWDTRVDTTDLQVPRVRDGGGTANDTGRSDEEIDVVGGGAARSVHVHYSTRVTSVGPTA